MIRYLKVKERCLWSYN